LAHPAWSAGAPVVKWVVTGSDPERVTVEVEVSGLRQESIDLLASAGTAVAEWERILRVYAEQGTLAADIGLPPMLGEYRVGAGCIRFTPRFPLENGVKYRAVFKPEALPGNATGSAGIVASTFQLPPRDAGPSTVVDRVYPTAKLLPENLLKFYLHFSAPMSRGGIYRHIHLVDDSGKDVELPFLELDEELWSPDMTRLTLFIDPGRIKREVKPLEEIGPSLESGRRYRLVIDGAWQDAAGNPLKRSFEHDFDIGPPDREPPDPARWKLGLPGGGTQEPLRVDFGESMDHALALRVLRVADASGAVLAGTPALENEERSWGFAPDRPWAQGRYWIRIQTTLEDLAGNNIGKPFEVDLFDGVGKRLTNEVAELRFEIR
jgi:hypothetical protein